MDGVTDIVDMSTYPEAYEPMRRLMQLFPAPYNFLAARITTPGGDGAEAGRGEIFGLSDAQNLTCLYLCKATLLDRAKILPRVFFNAVSRLFHINSAFSRKLIPRRLGAAG